MKLVHCSLLRQLLLKEYGITQWIIENPSLFGSYVQELYSQSEGEEGRFVLSDGDKELNIAKNLEIIMNPLLVNINHKKILSKLYAELAEEANAEVQFLETRQVMNQLQQYFYQLEQSCEYMLEIEQEISLIELFKVMGVRIIETEGDYFSNLMQYLKIVAGLLGKPVIVIVNATAYFTMSQIKQLQEMAIYQELRILFIESEKKKLEIKGLHYIIDVDMCEI